MYAFKYCIIFEEKFAIFNDLYFVERTGKRCIFLLVLVIYLPQ